MRVVLHRVESARALHEGEPVARIGPGLVALVGFERGDGPSEVDHLARKVCNLRVFEAGDSKFGRSLLDRQGEMLVLSQFSLHADLGRGRRPGLHRNLAHEASRTLYRRFLDAVGREGVAVWGTPFASRILLEAVHWGPFTLVVDRAPRT